MNGEGAGEWEDIDPIRKSTAVKTSLSWNSTHTQYHFGHGSLLLDVTKAAVYTHSSDTTHSPVYKLIEFSVLASW